MKLAESTQRNKAVKKTGGTFFKRTMHSKEPFFFQAKLKIGPANDRYEQEADAMAGRVMSMESSIGNGPTNLPSGIQRKCVACNEEEGLQAKPDFQKQQFPPQVKSLSMKPLQGASSASSQLASKLSQNRGNGSSLPDTTNNFMSNAFGTDFSSVKIHTDSDAIQMNQEVRARAFTHGSDIYFNSGEYKPNSSEGKRLLAHELTHVLQQTGSNSGMVQRETNAPDIQLLRIAYPNQESGRLQHRARMNNTYSVPWDVFLNDDIITLKFRYLSSDDASVHVLLRDNEGARYLGTGSVHWGPEDSETKYIEFSQFPTRADGSELNRVEIDAQLVNDSDESRGISGWKYYYSGL